MISLNESCVGVLVERDQKERFRGFQGWLRVVACNPIIFSPFLFIAPINCFASHLPQSCSVLLINSFELSQSPPTASSFARSESSLCFIDHLTPYSFLLATFLRPPQFRNFNRFPTPEPGGATPVPSAYRQFWYFEPDDECHAVRTTHILMVAALMGLYLQVSFL
jgi:hypothetical protein